MEFVISNSKKPGKQFDSRIYGKHRFRLDRRGLHILQNIKIHRETNCMLIGISNMRIGLNHV